MLVAAVAALALLAGGYFFLQKWEPNSQGENSSEALLGQNEETEYLINTDYSEIASVTVNNGEETYTVKNGENPSIEGYSSHIIDSSKLSSLIYSSSSVAISHKIKGKGDSLSLYGLDSPEKWVLISMKDGTKYKLVIGNSANFEGEYYAMLEGEDFVCTVSSYDIESLMKSPSEMRSMDICTLDGQSIASFTIKKNGKKEISVKYDENFKPSNEYQTVSYLVTYPYNNVNASLDKLQALFEKISSLTAQSIVEENPSNLKKYGLDKPYELEITDHEGKTTKIKMGSYGEDGNVYVMLSGVPVVYLADCPFYEVVKESRADDYVDRFINLFSIDAVKSIKVKAEGKTHTLEITKKSDDESIYKINDKLVSEKPFKEIYQLIIGVTATDFVNKEPAGDKKCEFIFKFTDNTKKTFTYYTYDDRYCIVKADNGLKCLTLTKNLDAVKDRLK